METNGGPSAKREELLIPLQKYKTTLYTHSDEVPEKLQPTDQVSSWANNEPQKLVQSVSPGGLTLSSLLQ